MPERTSYEPGTPSWVDLGTSDTDAARAFYGELFGWTADEAGPVEETGGYAMFRNDGRLVAGLGPLMSEGQPVAWSTYVSTDDLDALTERAKAAGATVIAEPMQVMDAGRMAFFMHAAGGVIGAWEPGQHKGAELVNEPGSFTWNELHTRDIDGAKAFGEAVFGWTTSEWDMGTGVYTLFNVGENGVAGATDVPPGVPEEIPSLLDDLLRRRRRRRRGREGPRARRQRDDGADGRRGRRPLRDRHRSAGRDVRRDQERSAIVISSHGR